MNRIMISALLLCALSGAAAAAEVDMNDSVRATSNKALDQPLPDTQGITPPRAANSHTMTDYPEISRVNQEQGRVLLKFVVNADGSVSNVQVDQSSGYPRLDQAAVDQVTANWRYVPAMKDGKPIAVALHAGVTWTLRNDEDAPVQYFELSKGDFPPGAYEKGETGVTALMTIVNSHGQIQETRIVKSSGYTDLDDAASKIARGWHTTPLTINGKPSTSAVAAEFHWPAKQ